MARIKPATNPPKKTTSSKPRSKTTVDMPKTAAKAKTKSRGVEKKKKGAPSYNHRAFTPY